MSNPKPTRRRSLMLLSLVLVTGACSSGSGSKLAAGTSSSAPTSTSAPATDAPGSSTTSSTAGSTGTSAPRSATTAGKSSASSTTVASRSPATTAVARQPDIVIVDFSFKPAILNVAAGATVVAKNNGPSPHTWTANDGSWDSGNMNTGATFSHKFTTAGSYPYLCSLHPSMTGVVQVS